MKLQMKAVLPRRAACAAAFAVVVVALTWVAGAYAQSKGTPYALFQYATLVGSGNTLTASRIPVVVATGNTIFKNITIQFEVDPDGNLTVSPDNPQISDAPPLQVSSFKAGSYIGPGSILGGKTPAFVDGPGATEGGATSWSFSTGSGADTCTYPNSATWYVGPIENTPVAARLKAAGITSTAWSYGVANGPGRNDRCTTGAFMNNAQWEPGTLVGVSQSGNAITIASFTDSPNVRRDYSAPVAQITYRLVP
jgi:hypothetical protein